MGFKTDREFLRNITIGAVGTRKVAEILRGVGYGIIELERYASSNKIWATKIKRLRVPDLICLRSGIRIESRAKASLKVTMSHAVNKPERAWDRGLRDDDLVAFIKCHDRDGRWVAGDVLSLFRVQDMRSTQDAAGLSQMKSAAEGSEIQLTWPATIPNQAGRVTAVERDRIQTVLTSGRRQSYSLVSRKGGKAYTLKPYVRVGDVFGAEEQVIASVMPRIVGLSEPDCDQYDFIADLDDSERETVYAAAKALSYLPRLKDRSHRPLLTVMTEADDPLLCLEAAAALARLGDQEGWQGIVAATEMLDRDDVRMEAALILSELPGQRPLTILRRIAADRQNPSELRAACVWGMGCQGYDLTETRLLDLRRCKGIMF